MTTSVSGIKRGRLVEYVPWMARDYATNQGPSTVIVALLIGFLTLAPSLQAGLVRLGDFPEEIATRTLRLLAAPLAFIGVLFATNGIVSNDRKLGYYRFLFSKPIGPPSYYATVFAVNGVGLMLVCFVFMVFWSLVARPMIPLGLPLSVLIIYVAYGGLGFLLSAAWRFDWLSLVTVLFAANVGWAVWGSMTGLRRWALYLLPPVHRANDVYGLILRESSASIPWPSIGWFLGYGVLCFALGLIVIRKRPLGTS